MAILKVLKGKQRGEFVKLRGGQIVFGRHPDCHVVLSSSSVSRRHSQIILNDGVFYLEDLKSQNGTHLNGIKIDTSTPLNESDEIAICDFSFRFYLTKPASDKENAKKPSSETKPSKVDNEGPKTDDSQRATIDLDADGFVVGESKHPADGFRRTDEFDNVLGPELNDDLLADDLEAGSSSIIAQIELSSSNSSHAINSSAKLRAVLEISNSLAQVLDLGEVLNQILESLFKIVTQADEGCVLLKDVETNELIVKASRLRNDREGRFPPVSTTIIRQALATGKAILSSDASDDSRFSSSESLQSMSIRSVICVPLVGKSDVSLGVIQIVSVDSRSQFNEDDLELMVSVAAQSSLAIDNAHMHEGLLRKSRLERDVMFAKEVQEGFLPDAPPSIAGYEFYNYYKAAESVGGDYFNYISMPNGKIAVTLADVSGKGVSAALLMAKFSSEVRLHLKTCSSVAEAMNQLNAEVCSTAYGQRFITCVIIVIDPENHRLTIANAGHIPPAYRTADGVVSTVTLDDSGMPLGLILEQKFRERNYDIGPGDTWLLWTDGVTEAQNSQRKIYGSKRLIESFQNSSDDIESIVTGIIDDVREFTSGQEQSDDICVVGFRRLPRG